MFQTIIEKNAIVTEVQAICVHPYEAYWTAAVYAYTGLLLAFGTFIAWETRTVTVPELNDSKYIGACIYNVVVVCLFGVPMLHVLPSEQATMRFVLENLFVVMSTTICQCIIFIPKVIVYLYRTEQNVLVGSLNTCGCIKGSENNRG